MNIWVPKTKILEPRDPIIPAGAGVAGYFKIEGFKPDGRRRLVADWQKNLITDGGLQRWGYGAPIAYCSVGSGLTAVANSDTDLETWVATHDSIPGGSSGAQSSSPYYGWTRYIFRFNPPGVDYTLGEIGTGWSVAGEDLFTHANISPTVTWFSDETLDITYEIRVYPPAADRVYETLLAGEVREGIIRAMGVTDGNQWQFLNDEFQFDVRGNGDAAGLWVANGAIGLITGEPTGDWAGCTTTSQTAYADNYKRRATCRLESAEGNLDDGISVIYYNGYGMWQMSVDPPIAKVVGTTLTLNVETMSWGRYTP